MPSQTNNEFQFFLKALSYLRTHWWLFALEACVIFSIWITKFYRTPNVYESQAQILIDSSTRQMYQTVFTNDRRNTAQRENMVNLLRSPEVMDYFTERLTEHFFKEGKPSYLNPFFPGGKVFPSSRFLHWISLTWNSSSDVYGIRCVAMNPDAAHDLCQVYLGTLQETYPKFGQRGVQNKRDFLARQISSLHRQIVDREMQLAEFEKDNVDYVNFRTAIIENQSLQGLRNRLLELTHKIKLNRSISKLLHGNENTEGMSPGTFAKTRASLKEQLSELLYRRHLTENSKSKDKTDRLFEIRKEINGIKAQIKALKQREQLSATNNQVMSETRQRQMSSDLEVQYRISLIKIRNLKKEIEEIEIQKAKYRQVDLEYNRLRSELEHKTRLLANLYKREQDAEIELSAVRSEIFKLKRPSRSGHRTDPQLSKHVFAGLSLSIFVIIATMILLAIFFPRLDSEADLAKLNLPVLGKIPVFRDWLSRVTSLSPFALEYIKIMSYRIMRETKSKKCPTIIVTSPQAGEGKSTVTYFLSLASKSPGKKCLFIDGDLITNHPNTFFGVQEDKTGGLKELLENPEADTKSLIMETDQEGVYFMPRGGKVDSVSSPEYLKPAKDALVKLREEFDVIYIDTPPLFASSLAHQWAGLGDLIVLVARMYHTRPKDVLEGLQTCKIFSKAPVGIALNCLPMHKQPGRGSYYYYFSRYYPKKGKGKAAA